jgi:hypothetical protein
VISTFAEIRDMRTDRLDRTSDANWLDAHFESARPEYEEGLQFVGL